MTLNTLERKRYFVPEQFERKEFARIMAENGRVALEKRISTYPAFGVDTAGRPDFGVTINNESDKKEVQAMFVAQAMAREEDYLNFLWISPPGGDNHYAKSRFTWLRVSEVNKDKVIFDDNRGICGELTQIECMQLAERLCESGAEMWGRPSSPEDLRGLVLGFKDEAVLDRLETYLSGMAPVWKQIETGGDHQNMNHLEEIAAWVENNFGDRMRSVRTYNESVKVGVMVERALQRRFGYSLMFGGGHGLSNMAVILSGESLYDSVYSKSKLVTSISSELEVCDKCKKHFDKSKKKCPKCSRNE